MAAPVQRALVMAVLEDVAQERDVPEMVVGAVVDAVVDVAGDSEISCSIINLWPTPTEERVNVSLL